MPIDQIPINLTDILPAEIASSLGKYLIFLKAAGILLLIYIIYLIVMGIINFRKARRLKRVEKKLDLIMKKLKIHEPKKKNKKKKK